MSGARREERGKKLRAGAVVAEVKGDGEDASQKAVMNVVQVWLDRLQLISVITTFFASIDGTILSTTISLTKPGTLSSDDWSNTTQLTNASLAGALIFHVCAAITSFVGSFILIRYKLNDADAPLHRTLPRIIPPPSPAISAPQIEKSSSARYSSDHAATLTDAPALSHTRSESHRPASPFMQATHAEVTAVAAALQSWSDTLAQFECRVYVHTVRPLFARRTGDRDGTAAEPPVRLLARCHTLSVWMAVAGFVLALLGILAFAWSALPVAVAAFASACLGACLLALLATLSFS